MAFRSNRGNDLTGTNAVTSIPLFDKDGLGEICGLTGQCEQSLPKQPSKIPLAPPLIKGEVDRIPLFDKEGLGEILVFAVKTNEH